jgi:hypothetical protein
MRILQQLINEAVDNHVGDAFVLGCDKDGRLANMLSNRWAFVTGFEYNEKKVLRAKNRRRERVAFVKIRPLANNLVPYLENGEPKLVVICNTLGRITGYDHIEIFRLSEVFFNTGVQFVALEADPNETKMFMLHYELVKCEGRCVVMMRRPNKIKI